MFFRIGLFTKYILLMLINMYIKVKIDVYRVNINVYLIDKCKK